jgi:signal transduction histidine kinase
MDNIQLDRRHARDTTGVLCTALKEGMGDIVVRHRALPDLQRMKLRLLRIKSDINQESSHVLVTFEDSGTGINVKDERRIFEPFFTTKSSGAGIGFTICKSILESHGGSLHVSANDPYGTIFHVALPSRD